MFSSKAIGQSMHFIGKISAHRAAAARGSRFGTDLQIVCPVSRRILDLVHGSLPAIGATIYYRAPQLLPRGWAGTSHDRLSKVRSTTADSSRSKWAAVAVQELRSNRDREQG